MLAVLMAARGAVPSALACVARPSGREWQPLEEDAKAAPRLREADVRGEPGARRAAPVLAQSFADWLGDEGSNETYHVSEQEGHALLADMCAEALADLLSSSGGAGGEQKRGSSAEVVAECAA